MPRDSGYSLRQRLLVRLWGTLFIVLVLSTVAALALARHIGTVVYDHWLYDSAMTLAEQVKVRDGKSVLDLPRSAVEMFEWDRVDRVFGEVSSQKSGMLFSNARFPKLGGTLVPGKPRFYDTQVNGKQARVVALRLKEGAAPDDEVIIQVAETRVKRDSLLSDILLIFLPLQAMILVVTCLLVWFAVTSSLRAVEDIAARLSTYEPERLEPIDDLKYLPNELRPLLDATNQLIGKVADAQLTQRRFVANAAHQLRTPLATLQVQAERALREPDPARINEALAHVLKAITRSRHMVHQLLTLARSDRSAEKTLEMGEVDLAELAREELERSADAAIARGIDLGYEGPDAGGRLVGEAYLLREMIANLVDNAIRYGRENGQVTLGLTLSPLTLYVDDDGPGVPPEDRALIFERFYRRPGAAGDGCGLGLAIAKEIAARHGAVLRVLDNPAGQGARLEVQFS